MRNGTWFWLGRRFINKTCGIITAAGLRQEPFKKVIWCSVSFKTRLICTSYPRLGKGPLWSARICTTDHTTSLTFEKTHVALRRRPGGHGTSLSYGLIMLEATGFSYVYIST